MKKIILMILSLFFLVTSILPLTALANHPEGLLNTASSIISGWENPDYAYDDDHDSYAYLKFIDAYTGKNTDFRWTFENPVTVDSFVLDLRITGDAYFYLYAKKSDNTEVKLIHYISSEDYPRHDSNVVNLSKPITDVEEIFVFSLRFNNSLPSFQLFELEVYGEVQTPLVPSAPINLSATSDINSIDFLWDLNSVEENVLGYNLYEYGVKKNTELITTDSFKLLNVVPDQIKKYQITAVSTGGESAMSSAVYSSAMSEQNPPLLSYDILKDTSLRLTWTDVAANKYLVYKDDVFVKDTIYKFMDINNLDPDTTYDFKVVAEDKYGRLVDSNIITITTKSPFLNNPIVSITDIKEDSFIVKWNQVQYADTYNLYIDGVLVYTGTDLSYNVSFLEPNTLYMIKVEAISATDSSDTVLSTITLLPEKPKILSATISGGSAPTSKKLNYIANDKVTAVDLYINGDLIGTYPVDQNEIQLDFADIEGLMADVDLIPVDPEAEKYSMTVPVEGTYNDFVDSILMRLLNALGLSKNAFIYLALVSVPLFVLVALFFWYRWKFKKMHPKSYEKNTRRANKKMKKDLSERQKLSGGTEDGNETQDFNNLGQVKKYKKYKPWNQLSEQEKMSYRSKKHEQKTGFKIIDIKKKNIPIGLLGLGGVKQKEFITFEKEGVNYIQKYQRGKGRVYVPKTFSDSKKLLTNNINKFSSDFKKR